MSSARDGARPNMLFWIFSASSTVRGMLSSASFSLISESESLERSIISFVKLIRYYLNASLGRVVNILKIGIGVRKFGKQDFFKLFIATQTFNHLSAVKDKRLVLIQQYKEAFDAYQRSRVHIQLPKHPEF